MKVTERLDKLLAHAGFGTRSELKKLVKRGGVEVNGKPVKDSGMQVDPQLDVIQVDGAPVVIKKFVYFMLHKPQGVVSATEDRQDRTVLDLLRAEHRHYAVFPVGRLDKDTEGLLLLTNDGGLAHRLLSPRKHVPKTYFAQVEGRVDEADVAAFRQGVTLDDGYVTMPAELRVLEAGAISRIELTIHEGKFHQVKRMFATVGKKVVYLKRVSMGALSLDDSLPLGQYRELTDAELDRLQLDRQEDADALPDHRARRRRDAAE